ncbi:MAG TPA: zinc ABC transporter substrate-binding protein, partial [Thermomicrobiales bacterium]|nr:zinc ABC transporter substrate-binding protein [Thermomicrobiales bacterium]
TSRDEDKFTIVATTGQVGDLARQIGRDHVNVTTLMGPGVDPHLFKASESNVIDLIEADLILYSGIHLEGNLAEVLEQAEKQIPTTAVTEGIPEADLIMPLDDSFYGNPDPHFWFDPTLWTMATDQVAEAFAMADPANAEEYRANAEEYKVEVMALDAWAAERFVDVPEQSRILVTAHDAFGYLGRRYGLEVAGLQGISTSSEAGVRDVQNIADLITANEVKAIFVESSVPRRTIEAVQVAVADRGWNVAIGDALYSDALGDADTPEGTWLGMMRYNIDTIVSGLTGEDHTT